MTVLEIIIVERSGLNSTFLSGAHSLTNLKATSALEVTVSMMLNPVPAQYLDRHAGNDGGRRGTSL